MKEGFDLRGPHMLKINTIWNAFAAIERFRPSGFTREFAHFTPTAITVSILHSLDFGQTHSSPDNLIPWALVFSDIFLAATLTKS